MFLNIYSNFGLASSVVQTLRVRLGCVISSLPYLDDASLVILQTAAYLIASVSSPRLLQFSSLYCIYNKTKYDIKHHCLFSFSFKHINSRSNVVQGMYITMKRNIISKSIASFNFHFNIID